MIRTKRFALMILLAAGLLSGQPRSPNRQEGGWLSYSRPDFGYAIQYPRGWEVIEAEPKKEPKAVWGGYILIGDEIQKTTFLEKDYDLWQGELQVILYRNEEGLSLAQWLEKNEPQDVEGGSLVQEVSDVRLAGCPAKRLSIFGFDHEQLEIDFIYKGHVLSITYTGQNPNDPQLKKHQEIYAFMIRSFELSE